MIISADDYYLHFFFIFLVTNFLLLSQLNNIVIIICVVIEEIKKFHMLRLCKVQYNFSSTLKVVYSVRTLYSIQSIHSSCTIQWISKFSAFPFHFAYFSIR